MPNPLPLASAVLNYAVVFLLIALVAGVLGFGVVAGTAAMVAKMLFVVCLAVFIFAIIDRSKT